MQIFFPKFAIYLGLICALTMPALGYAQTVDSAADQPVDTQDWNFHAQMTAVGQGDPPFHGTNGPQSLSSHGEIRETTSETFFGGVRMPWSTDENTTEFYVDPEFNQGFGLSRVAGVGGFPNGEGEKSGSDWPRIDMARTFVRQTFGLGGDRENVDSDQNQLAQARDVERVTFTVGKVAVTDFFDNNSYSHDARTQFLNIALVDAGAYDYAGNQKGYTDGGVAELNQKDWAIRYGWFFVPKYSNAKDLHESFSTGANNLELEERYKIADQPGTLRILGFANIANAGSYRETLDNPALGTDIAATRTDRVKYGFVLNAEQAINDDLGLFSRYSWNDGQEEIVSYTDIDQSFSFGASLKGTSWDRPDDVVGLADAVDFLSQAEIDFLKAGGATILLGDGFLSYAPENIIETYYSYRVFKPLSVAADYQFIANPGYNQARGPANIFSVRGHLEF